MPVYPLSYGITNKDIMNTIRMVFENKDIRIPEYMPEHLMKKYRLCGIEYAIKNIHFPKDKESLKVALYRLIFEELLVLQLGLFMYKGGSSDKKGIVFKRDSRLDDVLESLPVALYRLIFEELLVLQLGLFMYKGGSSDKKGIVFKRDSRLDDVLESLPFKLTRAQSRALNEIIDDMCSEKVMNRLVQGDVGSGKTVVALLALAECVFNGYQGALMAPTEILAQQHYESFTELVQGDVGSGKTVVALLALAECVFNGYQGALMAPTEILAQQHYESFTETFEGDVGSGKTVVALLALAECVFNGYQGALMAPTEILAQQHYESFTETFEDIGINVELLTGSVTKKQKEFNGYQGALMAPTEILAQQHYESFTETFEDIGINVELLTGSVTKKQKEGILQRVKDGEVDILIGTHALIEDNVEFENIGLVITDEQHRFGVRQRGKLSSKGVSPDILVMTATPIPRTLALILYGDLDISIID